MKTPISSMSGPDVSPESTRFLALLEQRIALLGNLAESLTFARESLGTLDINSLEARIAMQQQLCTQISALDSEIDRVQRQCSATIHGATGTSGNSSAQDSRMRDTLARLHAVQSNVKHLNEAHQVLLQRSRRTLGALLNSYRCFSATYADPAARQTALGEMV